MKLRMPYRQLLPLLAVTSLVGATTLLVPHVSSHATLPRVEFTKAGLQGTYTSSGLSGDGSAGSIGRRTKPLEIAPFATSSLVPDANAQALPTKPLEIDTENEVVYITDVFDYSKFASDPNRTTSQAPPRNFATFLQIGDIVAVDGEPAKGTRVIWGRVLRLRPNAAAGDAIADVNRTNILEEYYEILQPDGTPVGTIVATGLGSGVPAPGAPTVHALAITGGTGAFLGVRGWTGLSQLTAPLRRASQTEDPAVRRALGGGALKRTLNIIKNKTGKG